MQSELEKNYFELFGLPARFTIDLSDLASRYRELQKKFHPDKYASKPDGERRLASQMAAQINAGYQALKSPLERGRYLLKLSGIQLDDEKDTKMEQGFLMEQMEIREELEEAMSASDPLSALEKTARHAESGMRSRINELDQLFQVDGTDNLLEARNKLREMQFLDKILHDIRQKEDELLD